LQLLSPRRGDPTVSRKNHSGGGCALEVAHVKFVDSACSRRLVQELLSSAVWLLWPGCFFLCRKKGDSEKAAGAGADTRQAMSERRRAPGEHGRLLTAEKAAGAGADTRQVMAEKRQTPGPTPSLRCRKDGGRWGRNTTGLPTAETAAVRLSESMYRLQGGV
jgi:hypothetical protein